VQFPLGHENSGFGDGRESEASRPLYIALFRSYGICTPTLSQNATSLNDKERDK
jgi:hypothetical protein